MSSVPKSSAATEAEYFDRYVESHDDFNPFADRAWDNLRRRFTERLQGRRPVRLLDIGCGTGQSRQIYRDNTREYVGIDLSTSAIRRAAALFPVDHWLAADATALPLENESFDAIAFSSVLHHIPNYTAALQEAYRVLRPGGLVFAFDPNALHPAMALLRVPQSPFYSSKGVSPNERPLLGSALRRAFASAGLVALWQRGQSDLPYRSTQVKWVNALLGLYNAADRVAEFSGMGRWFGTFLITAGYKPV